MISTKISTAQITHQSRCYRDIEDRCARQAAVGYQLPDETVTMKPGKNIEVFENNCIACHSSDYIETQPQGAAIKPNFWQAEVTKMIKVDRAPIDEADVSKIVHYLSENS